VPLRDFARRSAFSPMTIGGLPAYGRGVDGFRSGDGLIAFDRELTVSAWNAAAERLTGICAAEAVGRKCWDVLRGTDGRGNVVCHRGCAGAREALAGRPPSAQRLWVRGRPVLVSTIVTGEGFLHVLTPRTRRSTVVLSPRRREVLALLAEGLHAKQIALQLGIAKATVRAHIRTLLRDLDAHSQLEAVAHARRRGLLAD
jgi:DNA-binding CsgD family transcriptional regulator